MKSPNGWSCLPCSFATVLGVTLEEILEYVGHNGSDIMWPELPEPKCRKGFHIQEMISFSFEKGRTVTPFEPVPLSIPVEGAKPCIITFRYGAQNRMNSLLTGRNGVLEGNGHAVAWYNGIIHDPALGINRLEDFPIRRFWLISKIKSC